MKLQKILTALIGGLCVTAAAHAENYPSKPVTLIVPFAPGGTTDIVGRILAEHLSRQLGQPVVVENRGGAGGAIGAAAIAKAAPDGYTLGIATVSTHAVNPACQEKLAYDPIKDFAAVSNIASSPNMLAVNAKFPSEYSQFIKEVKSHPGKYSFASSGVCGLAHMMGEQFKVSTSTDILHVPYKGMGPAINDVLGGQVQMLFDNVPSSLPHVKAGKLKAVAVAWNKRLDSMPDVPTFAELGLKEVNDPAWYGLVAPANTPPEIVSALNTAVVKALATPEAKERLAAVGTEPVGNSPEQYAGQIASELKKVKAIVAKQGITPN
jgi:tripartite-type tricarboxylate transporter receptor subunit TctC